MINVDRPERRAHLTLRWRGGALTELDLSLPRTKPPGPRTDEDTISLLRRLAAFYPDDVIAGIFNRQGRRTANGERFTAHHVSGLRRYRNIPRYEPPAEPPTGEVVSVRQAAEILGIDPIILRSTSTLPTDAAASPGAHSNEHARLPVPIPGPAGPPEKVPPDAIGLETPRKLQCTGPR